MPITSTPFPFFLIILLTIFLLNSLKYLFHFFANKILDNLQTLYPRTSPQITFFHFSSCIIK